MGLLSLADWLAGSNEVPLNSLLCWTGSLPAPPALFPLDEDRMYAVSLDAGTKWRRRRRWRILVAIANWHREPSGPAGLLVFPAPPVSLPSRSDVWPQSDRLAPIFFSAFCHVVLPSPYYYSNSLLVEQKVPFYKPAESFFTAAPPVRRAKQREFFFFNFLTLHLLQIPMGH